MINVGERTEDPIAIYLAMAICMYSTDFHISSFLFEYVLARRRESNQGNIPRSWKG